MRHEPLGCISANYPRAALERYGAIKAFKILLNYGIESKIPECRQLRQDLAEIRFAKNPPRNAILSLEQVEAFVGECIKRGRSNSVSEKERRLFLRMALTVAIQFECTLRQVDVIGQWEPAGNDYHALPGEVLHRGRVWRGMTMDMISLDDDLAIRTTKTGQPVVHALAGCELVVRCLQELSLSDRSGPVAIRRDGLPWYDSNQFAKAWRKIARDIGIPDEIQNRDSRASGISEASEAGASDDDIAMGAGHAHKSTTQRIYKREGHEASIRVQSLRQKFRRKVARQDADSEDGFPAPDDLDE
jgi:integrase